MIDLKGAAVEEITSRQNSLVKRLASLREKKYREKEGLFPLDGVKLTEEALLAAEQDPLGVSIPYLCLMASRKENLLSRLSKTVLPKETRVLLLSDEAFSKISEEKSPEGAICILKALDKSHKMVTINRGGILPPLEEALPVGNLLFLSSLRDPGNLGTVLRTAAAFGASAVLLSEDCADLYSEKTLRASMGALFRIPTLRVQGKTEEAIACLRKTRRVFSTALDPNALPLGSFSLETNDCFVIGNEGHGLEDAVIKASTGCVYIPMTGGSESLNAAVAASVCLWEMQKEREKNA